MPKFLVTSGSYFQPFTYDELAKPIAQTVEAHNAAQDVYDTLSDGTEALRQYIMKEPDDSEARRLYEDYVTRLTNLQNNLWNKGYGAGTRRDLSLARSGYQSNIARLATAVKDRSERSAAYWDAKHKNPNLVTGNDPGLDGLDDYLRDENHGLNWFSYDSAQFEKDVFTEMQARAQSMMSDLTDENGVVSNKALADTLTRVINYGATGDEVSAATSLVDGLIDMSPEQRDAYYQEHSISPVVSMMVESLINRYDATGIRGYDVSASEQSKLLNRGKAGLVGMLMKPEIKDFTNPEYEFDMWKRKEEIQHQNRMEELGAKGGSGSGSGGKDAKAPGSYSIQTLSSYLDSPEAKEITSYVNKKFENKYEESIPVTGINGEPDSINSPYDVQRILDDLGRSDFKNRYGVDPSEQIIGTYDVVDGGGDMHRLTVSSASGGYAGRPDEYVISYDGVPNMNLSKYFSQDYREFKKRLNEWRDKNGGIDILDLKIKEKDWKKMQDEHDLDGIPREYWPSIMTAKADIGYRTPSYLASYTTDMPEVRENYASAAYSAYTRAPKKDGNNVEKTSDVAVKKVTPDGKVIGVERDMRNVLGTKGSGKGNKQVRTDSIQEIYAHPEDVLNNQIRFTTDTYSGEYAANPVIFGNQVAAVYRDLRKPVYEVYEDGSYRLIDNDGIVDYMMMPITEPASVFRMSDQEKRDWTRITANTLDGYMEFYSTDANGNINGTVSPVTIVMYPNYREALRSAISNYINAGLAGPRDALNTEIMQKKSGSVANPGTMDLGLMNQSE